MKKIIRSFLILYLIAFATSAQELGVKSFPTRINFTYETLNQDFEPDLGFFGAGLDVFNISNKIPNLYFGLHSYGTLAGERPGLITLGITSGLRLPLIEKQQFFVDFGFFAGAGGGGGADDGGGLILRPHINLEKQFKNIGFTLGYSRIDFPTGSVSGNQLNFGITLNSTQYLKSFKNKIKDLKPIAIDFRNIRFSVVGTSYFGLKEGSVSSANFPEDQKIILAGIQVEKDIVGESLYGIFKINGALQGGVDGYMSILFGAGGKLPVVKKTINLESRVLFGPSGGGAVESGGGATMQIEAGPSIVFKNDYFIKIMAGKTFAPWGDFNANHIEFGIGKVLKGLAPKLEKDQTEFTVSKDQVKENHLSFAVHNRTYFGLDGLDKGNQPYLSSFNLLGFEIQKYVTNRLSINGGTVWAYQGDYGAYAEGLLGAAYHQPVFSKINLIGKAMFGAGGGGGLNIGSGLIFQYTGGVEYKLGNKLNFYATAGKYQPLKGNFDPYILDIGFKVHLYQLFGK